MALCTDRIEIYCEQNRRGVNRKLLRRFIDGRTDRKKADYRCHPRPSLRITRDLFGVTCYLVFHGISGQSSAAFTIAEGVKHSQTSEAEINKTLCAPTL